MKKFVEFWIILKTRLLQFLQLLDVFSIFDFASLVGTPIGITSFAIVLKICIITAGIKNHNLIIKKKKKHDRSVLLEKSKLKASIDPNNNLMNSF